jgi:hypothetical protein
LRSAAGILCEGREASGGDDDGCGEDDPEHAGLPAAGR